MAQKSTTHEFRAETRKVLNILTHSLYMNRDIFLRELISNASDALDKLRFIQSRGDEVHAPDLPLEIRITVDKERGVLSIADTGIGMTEAEMVENLGTIAHSGSEQFMKDMAEQSGSEDGKTDAANIIGRFGIGFYSVFMVAEKVEVISKSAIGDEPAHIWTSDGTGSFSIAEYKPEEGMPEVQRGTVIRAAIKDKDREFLEKSRLEAIIRKHSNFIPFPIYVDNEHINTTQALWREPRQSITREQYDEFYKFLSYDKRKPLEVIHLALDAPVQFNSLLFIPDTYEEYFTGNNEHWGLDLYVRRVLLQRENKEVLPDYLAFVKGVVDTEDLPINISRETLQENRVLRKIKQTVTKQVLSKLTDMAKDNPETYKTFWELHGKVFKLGYRDFANRELFAPLLRFNSSALESTNEFTSLDDYISRAKEGQKIIWFLTTPREAINANPHLELFRRKGIEVLYLFDTVDEFALEGMGVYKDFHFKSVDRADNETLKSFADSDETPKTAPLSETEITDFDGLVGKMKTLLGEQVKDVRVSQRLSDSPAVLVSPDEGLSSSMQKLMRMMQNDDSIPQKILEVNRDHPLLRSMLHIYKAKDDDPVLAEMIQSLFDATLLLDGYIKEPHMVAARSTKLLEKAASWYEGMR